MLHMITLRAWPFLNFQHFWNGIVGLHWDRGELQGSLLKGSFYKRVRIPLLVPLLVLTPPAPLPHPSHFALIFHRESHLPHHPPLTPLLRKLGGTKLVCSRDRKVCTFSLSFRAVRDVYLRKPGGEHSSSRCHSSCVPILLLLKIVWQEW